jgi:hypothetical protein
MAWLTPTEPAGWQGELPSASVAPERDYLTE